jgi:hypothetical protein
MIKVEKKDILSIEDLDRIKKELKDKHESLNKLQKKYMTEISNLNKECFNSKTIIEENKQKYESEINSLKEIIDNLIDVDIKFTKTVSGKQPNNIYVPLLSKEIILYNINELNKIKMLYKLEKLTITTNTLSLNFENKSLKTLVLCAPEIETLNGINKFPNLEVLELVSCDKLYDIKSFLHDTIIKKIVFKKCGENQKRNMISYCNAKNIELIYYDFNGKL